MIRKSMSLALVPALLSSTMALAAEPPTAAPVIHFVSLEIKDIARSKAFYMDTLGMKEIMAIDNPKHPRHQHEYALNFSGDPRSSEPLLVLVQYERPGPRQNKSSGAKFGIRVADARAMAAKMRGAGYEVLSEPKPDEKGMMLKTMVRDPDGVTVQLVETHFPPAP